jgi:hypothetical protein
MRRIANILILVAAVVGLHGCAADAPTNPGNGGGGGGNGALQVLLVTSDANPKAGTCTLIQATVTFNGAAVPEGTSVSFSTDFGTFSQTGLPLASVVTSNGTAVTALCGPAAGTARVRATASSGGRTGAATLTIVFQPDGGTLPFVSSCSPSFGPKEGGTLLTINGGRFSGTPATTRVQFVVNGVSKDGLVQSVTANQITVTTPGFPEFSSPQLLTELRLSFATNEAVPIVVSVPSCFSYGTQGSDTPTIASLLPASGTNEGGTRVTIVGSGFSTSSGVQVFFGTLEAQVISVSFSQVVVLSPRQVGDPVAVGVIVHNIGSGLDSNPVNYVYTEPMAITAFSNNVQPLNGPFSPMTIFGRGFQAPVAVSLAGWGAFVQSVSATEIVVIPGPATAEGCDDVSGEISITNINTGSNVTGGAFTYAVFPPIINGVTPGNSCPSNDNGCALSNGGVGGLDATITGANLENVDVLFGSQTAFIQSATPNSIVVSVPITATQPPQCGAGVPAGTPTFVGAVDITVTDRATTCTATAVEVFQYILPCTPPPPVGP